MKKLIITLLLILSINLSVSADLIDIYKRGEITLIPDPEFGVNTDWASLFRSPMDKESSIAFLPDGSFLRSSSRDSKIYKFNENGEFLFSFGQEGQGPGDLSSPGDLSILDGKYLAVREGLLTRRISIFDLDGKFVKLLKPNYIVESCTSLKDDKIAILTRKYGPGEREADTIKVSSVFIKDIATEKEVKVASFEQETRRTRLTAVHFYGSVYIAKIDNDKLLVAYSGIPEIHIYSSNGEKLSSFNLNLQRKKVKKSDIDRVLDGAIENLKSESEKDMMRQWIKMNRDEIFFPEYFPYYYKVAVDSEDNILVFLNNWIDDSPVTFQVYSKEGRYICQTQVNPGNFEPVYPENFHKNFLYATLKTNAGDDLPFLARIKLK